MGPRDLRLYDEAPPFRGWVASERCQDDWSFPNSSWMFCPPKSDSLLLLGERLSGYTCIHATTVCTRYRCNEHSLPCVFDRKTGLHNPWCVGVHGSNCPAMLVTTVLSISIGGRYSSLPFFILRGEQPHMGNCPENRTLMALKKMIDADTICADQLFLRGRPLGPASRFSSPVACNRPWGTALKKR